MRSSKYNELYWEKKIHTIWWILIDPNVEKSKIDNTINLSERTLN